MKGIETEFWWNQEIKKSIGKHLADDGGNKLLRNVGNYLPAYVMLHPS
jgi:hypothetical protein